MSVFLFGMFIGLILTFINSHERVIIPALQEGKLIGVIFYITMQSSIIGAVIFAFYKIIQFIGIVN
jgi:hypothetical protein